MSIDCRLFYLFLLLCVYLFLLQKQLLLLLAVLFLFLFLKEYEWPVAITTYVLSFPSSIAGFVFVFSFLLRVVASTTVLSFPSSIAGFVLVFSFLLWSVAGTTSVLTSPLLLSCLRFSFHLPLSVLYLWDNGVEVFDPLLLNLLFRWPRNRVFRYRKLRHLVRRVFQLLWWFRAAI